MMQQAAFEFGFEADDIPLMIEAIPSSSDSIVLIITKVEDPEELDTRFSKFAPSPFDDTDTARKSLQTSWRAQRISAASQQGERSSGRDAWKAGPDRVVRRDCHPSFFVRLS